MIRLLSSKEYSAKLKATIQSTGRLGFGADTASILDFASGRWAEFSRDDATGNLYITFINAETPDSFEIRSSSGYFYIATSQLFDSLGYDYEHETYMFDLVRQPTLDDQLVGQVFLMKERQLKRKEKNESEMITITV